MPIRKCLDVDYHLFAHLHPAFQRRRSHMGQQHDVGQIAQAGVKLVAVFINVQPRTGDFTGAQAAGQGVFVDHLAARCVDDHGGGF